MIVHDCLDTTKDFYKSMYDYANMFTNNPSPTQFRYDDEWPAVCYAHGIFNIEKIDGLSNQIAHLHANKSRNFNSVLEIGPGRGLISVVLSNMLYSVQSIDCNTASAHFMKATARKLYNKITNDTHILYNGDLDSAISLVNFDILDTVILVESIEHIYADEWNRFYNRLLPALRKNKGNLIITNEKNYWPLGEPGDAEQHISLIDDTFYDNLVKDGTALYREKSHICLQYGC